MIALRDYIVDTKLVRSFRAQLAPRYLDLSFFTLFWIFVSASILGLVHFLLSLPRLRELIYKAKREPFTSLPPHREIRSCYENVLAAIRREILHQVHDR